MTTDAWTAPTEEASQLPVDDTRPGIGLLIDVWHDPRGVVRTVLDDKGSYGVLPLAALMGYASLDFDGGLTDDWMRGMAVAMVVLAPLFGIVGLYVEAFFVWVATVVLGHGATLRQIAVGLAWGRVPDTIMSIPAALVAVAWAFGLVPEDVFTPALVAGIVVAVMGWVWSWFTMAHALGEVLGASAWRGLLAYLLPGVAAFGFALLAFAAIALS